MDGLSGCGLHADLYQSAAPPPRFFHTRAASRFASRLPATYKTHRTQPLLRSAARLTGHPTHARGTPPPPAASCALVAPTSAASRLRPALAVGCGCPPVVLARRRHSTTEVGRLRGGREDRTSVSAINSATRRTTSGCRVPGFYAALDGHQF
ncbi:hypothetical protein PVAP13_9KG037800 [Panicum virgatum]|uniref:Uncharacterized protein n=1 Tax=Panicum virgatum TaxID=38727 RepID=A0A8T0NIG1_PANVG|nr:hypothetical protein PVAP13_9KG037800 [Panicum virgatum]